MNQNLQEQINNIWAAVNELKSLITGSNGNAIDDGGEHNRVNKARSTERNDEHLTPKKKLITDYFEPENYANIGEKEKQTVEILNKRLLNWKLKWQI